MTLNKYGRPPKPENLMPSHDELEKRIRALPTDSAGRIKEPFCGFNAGTPVDKLICWNDSLDKRLTLKGLCPN